MLYKWDGGTNISLNSPYDITIVSSEGQHILDIYVNDTSGNKNHKVFVFTTDDSNPVITLVAPTNESVISSGSIIDLEISDNIGLEEILYNWDGITNISLDTPYDITIVSDEGQHILSIYVKDKADNWEIKVFVFTIDNPPQISLINIENGSLSNDEMTIDFEIYDLDMVDTVLYGWNSTASIPLVEPFSITSPSTEGIHILNIFANDTNGNFNESCFYFIIDKTRPVITLEDIINNSIISANTIIRLSVDDDNGISVVLVNWNNDQNDTLAFPYTVESPSANGSYSLYVYAKDMANNWYSVVFMFNIDNYAPTIILVSPTNNSIISPTAIINLTISDLSGIVTSVYSWNGGNNISLHSPYIISVPSNSGLHNLTVYVSDSVNNTKVVYYSFVIDSTPPVISIIRPAVNSIIKGGSEIWVNITDDNNLQSVDYCWGDSVNISMTYPYIVLAPAVDGSQILTIYATDKAQNEIKNTFLYVIDSTPPSVVIENLKDGQTVSGTISIKVIPEDENGIAYVAILANKLLLDNITTYPYIYEWNTKDGKWNDGNYIVSFRVSDNVGNINTEEYTITILNSDGDDGDLVKSLVRFIMSGEGIATIISIGTGAITLFKFIKGKLKKRKEKAKKEKKQENSRSKKKKG